MPLYCVLYVFIKVDGSTKEHRTGCGHHPLVHGKRGTWTKSPRREGGNLDTKFPCQSFRSFRALTTKDPRKKKSKKPICERGGTWTKFSVPISSQVPIVSTLSTFTTKDPPTGRALFLPLFLLSSCFPLFRPEKVLFIQVLLAAHHTEDSGNFGVTKATRIRSKVHSSRLGLLSGWSHYPVFSMVYSKACHHVFFIFLIFSSHPRPA